MPLDKTPYCMKTTYPCSVKTAADQKAYSQAWAKEKINPLEFHKYYDISVKYKVPVDVVAAIVHQSEQDNYDRLSARWKRESEKCKEKFPTFDFPTEVNHPETGPCFIAMLQNGIDISTAYEAVTKIRCYEPLAQEYEDHRKKQLLEKKTERESQRSKRKLLCAAAIFFAIVIFFCGKNAGYDSGYSSGKSAGYNLGQSKGYTRSDIQDAVAGYSLNPPEILTNKEKSKTVYITSTGSKYHKYGCQYLSQSRIPIPLTEAKNQGYTACSKCW